MSTDIADNTDAHAQRVQRLPWYAAVGVAVVTAALFELEAGYLICTQIQQAEASGYSPSASVMATLILSGIFRALLLATLAWALLRGRIDRAGTDGVRPAALLWTLLGALLLLLVLYEVGSFAGFAKLYPSLVDWFQGHGFYRIVMITGLSILVVKGLALAAMLVALLVAFWLACLAGRLARTERTAPMALIPQRRTVPLACALFYAGIQWALQDSFSGWLASYQYQGGMLSVLGTLIGTLVVFGLAFAGASMGAGRPLRTRPWRALSAALLTLVVQFSICIVAGVLWALLLVDHLDPRDGLSGQMVSLILFVAVLYLALLVILMRWFCGMLYERMQAPASGDDSALPTVPA